MSLLMIKMISQKYEMQLVQLKKLSIFLASLHYEDTWYQILLFSVKLVGLQNRRASGYFLKILKFIGRWKFSYLLPQVILLP